MRAPTTPWTCASPPRCSRSEASVGAAVAGRYRIPLKLQFRIDLYRASDGTLMASSLVRKSLNVPGSAKSVLAEAERLLRRIGKS